MVPYSSTSKKLVEHFFVSMVFWSGSIQVIAVLEELLINSTIFLGDSFKDQQVGLTIKNPES